MSGIVSSKSEHKSNACAVKEMLLADSPEWVGERGQHSSTHPLAVMLCTAATRCIVPSRSDTAQAS